MPVRLVPMAGDSASSLNGASAKNAGAAVETPCPHRHHRREGLSAGKPCASHLTDAGGGAAKPWLALDEPMAGIL